MNFQSKPNNIEHSITDIKKKEYTFVWEIKNFKLYDFEAEKELLSPKFSTGDNKSHTWDIKITKKEEHLSLFLRLHTNGPEINTTLIFTICSQENDEGVFEEASFLVRHNETDKRSFPNFVKIDHLLDEKNGLLKNGTLTIKCKLLYQGDVINCSQVDKSRLLSGSTMSYDMESLFKNKTLSDVTIVIGEDRFQAHKCILAARSRVFLAMFEHDMLEKKESVVKIEDVDPKVMKEVLRFIYCGRIKNEKPMTDLLAAANKYDLEELKSICEDKLLDTLDGENIGKTLVFADRFKAEKLKKYALNFIISHAKDINIEKFEADVEMYSPLLVDLVRESCL